MNVLTKNPIFSWGGGGVFFYKLTRNPNLTKSLFFFFFFFFFGGRGWGGVEGRGKREWAGKCTYMNK